MLRNRGDVPCTFRLLANAYHHHWEPISFRVGPRDDRAHFLSLHRTANWLRLHRAGRRARRLLTPFRGPHGAAWRRGATRSATRAWAVAHAASRAEPRWLPSVDDLA